MVRSGMSHFFLIIVLGLPGMPGWQKQVRK